MTIARRVRQWMASTLAGRAAASVAIAIAMTGCAGLPSQVQRPVSEAVAPQVAAATTLGRIADASRVESGSDETASGFRLLPSGEQAFDARIALVRRAEATIDVQYYLIASDTTGLQFLRELRDAAARGVRVRLLVDDLYAVGQDELFAGLAAHPNVEVRLFNPLPVREGSFASRIVFSLHDFGRINRRMHNKLFVVDNSFAIAGGRNIADEYFDRAEPANFIDMDVLASGPVVHELSAVFDSYWRSEHAFPVQSLTSGQTAREPQGARREFDETVADVATIEPVTTTDALGQSAVAAQLAAGRVEQHPGQVRVLADAPSKIASHDDADGAVMQAHLELIRSAQSDVLIASPYFVPGERGLTAIRQAMARDVHLSVMTNSLATTDEPLVHQGYAKYRYALLRMGASLYELMPGAGERRSDDSSFGSSGSRASLGRLHAKLAVVDEQRVAIGSMNMDRRSAHSNTEVGLVITSTEIAEQTITLLRRDRLPKSYRVRIAAGTSQQLEWAAPQEGQSERVLNAEPAARVGQSVRLWLGARVIGEEML